MSNIEKKYVDYAGLSAFQTLSANLMDAKISAMETFTGATSSSDGESGLVPAPEQGDQEKFLRGDGEWAAVSGAVTGVKGSSEQSYRSGYVEISKSDIGLGNVGNFLAVSTEANQGLDSTKQANARTNIGAGTSNFSGSYNDLTDKPTIPTVNNATLKIQKNGVDVKTFTANASTDVTANIEVPTKVSELTNDSGYITDAGVTGVKGNSESSYRTGQVNITATNIGLGNVGNFLAVSTVASQGLTDTQKTAARANIGLGTAAVKDVPSSGNASTSQVVMGDDSRLTDSRNAKDVSAWAKAATKPTYTASEVGAIATSAKGAANGVASLDSSTKIPVAQMPAAVKTTFIGTTAAWNALSSSSKAAYSMVVLTDD